MEINKKNINALKFQKYLLLLFILKIFNAIDSTVFKKWSLNNQKKIVFTKTLKFTLTSKYELKLL